jgi:exopolyphosphatase/guanosine-5'-triphosphate,3'-diphosphate pyrophosphatase
MSECFVKFAIIDIGSNAVRIYFRKVSANGSVSDLGFKRFGLRLGEDVFQYGVLLSASLAAMLEIMMECRDLAEEKGCDSIYAFGTSALREAGNRSQICEKVKITTGIKIAVISGDEEAEFLYEAVSGIFDLKGETGVLADLGGGSLELVLIEKGVKSNLESLPLGTVRLLRRFSYDPDHEAEFWKDSLIYVKDELNTLRRHISHRSLNSLIVTGGNARAIANLARMIAPIKSQFFKDFSQIHRDDFIAIKKVILMKSYSERQKVFNWKKDRTDVIVPALMVLEQMLELTATTHITVLEAGMRDGAMHRILRQQRVLAQAV